jgi:hypothetical protein
MPDEPAPRAPPASFPSVGIIDNFNRSDGEISDN